MAAATMGDPPVNIRDGYRPSNGTEGAYFREQTCDRCAVDHAWHIPPYEAPESCPILMDSLCGEHSYPSPDGPPQWHHDDSDGRSWCDGFVGPCECDTR